MNIGKQVWKTEQKELLLWLKSAYLEELEQQHTIAIVVP